MDRCMAVVEVCVGGGVYCRCSCVFWGGVDRCRVVVVKCGLW